MARYYRRRYYPRYRVKKRNWSSNIITSNTTLTFPEASNYGAGSAICLNPSQSVATVSQPFTIKNIKLSVSCIAPNATTLQGMDNIVVAIVYIPQGYNVTYATLTEHPEWFMAIKYIDNPTLDSAGGTFKPFTISTRLARKLQTGDSVQLCVFGQNNSGTALSCTIRFMAQWWTCAN